MFLQEFGDHANIVKLHNVIRAENDKDIYLVFEFMGKYPYVVLTGTLPVLKILLAALYD